MKPSILLAALTALALARPAAATNMTGYPCMLVQMPTTGSAWGNSGLANITIYTGPACSGSYVGTVGVCSGNATGCGANFLNDTVFAVIMQNVQAALAAVNQRVFVATTGSFLSTIYFYAAGY